MCRSRWLAVMLCVSAVASIAWTMPNRATVIHRPASFQFGTLPPPINVSRLQLEQINSIVESDLDDMAGLDIEPATNTATVYIVSSRETLASTQATTSSIRAVAAIQGPDQTWNLSFALATYSLRQLRDVQNEAHVKEPWATASRPYLAQWYVDPKSNNVVLGVTQPTIALTSAAQQTFGAMAHLTAAPRAFTASRTADFSPWDGGDVISTGNLTCTSGFSAYDTTGLAHGELGAAHCSLHAGDVVNQNGATMGQVAYRQYGVGSGQLDFRFVDSSYTGSDSAPVVWGNGGVSRIVTSSLTYRGIRGYQVCGSGSQTGENCNASVVSENICVTYQDGTSVCNLDEAASNDNSQLVIGGDSGGPVYHLNPGGDVQAVGIISGCIPLNPGLTCSTESPQMLFTPVAVMPSRYQVMTTTADPPVPASRPVLSPNQWLYHDQRLLSANGSYELVMQGDGNLVIYGPSGYTWASWTQGNNGAAVVMQGDGNLVIYGANGAIWWTNTQPNPGAWLYLRNDGNLYIYTWDGSSSLWHRP
jgi:hypothetical protein